MKMAAKAKITPTTIRAIASGSSWVTVHLPYQAIQTVVVFSMCERINDFLQNKSSISAWQKLGHMAKPKGKAPPFLFQASGRVIKLLRPEIEAVRVEVSNINTEIKAINQRITAINNDLDAIEARTAKMKVGVGETGAQ
jgi:hypothetical protein